ncbi:hypothetical protein [Chryseobacterium polytrichastri]|uniref:HEAT repeat-containing protein n=1 Tax=Chryseobacterium polytrichastri TaxID=1302687 RepID=A0A1M7EHH1_9FLAO|nr:hypothetical protein [Chryseobacterium polytrichastri]SHL91070.1 hypothetical protein SAMN05444267_102831 [Chryseobacterium polytrichastri]
MSRSIYLFLILLVFISCKKEYEVEDFRKELRPYLARLSKEKFVPVSDTMAKSFLEKNAKKDELIKLMDAKNPLLRVIAYRAIVNKSEPEYFDLLIKHLDDTAKVTWQYYEDASGVFTVSDLMIRKAYDENGLSPIQKKYLVEKVLLEYPFLDVSNWMIKDVDANEKYYNLIKYKSKVENEDKCGDQLIACYALSKFNKKEDVNFLYNVFHNSINGYCVESIFKSIEAFPDKIFFKLLKDYFEKNIKNKLTSKENITDDVLYFARAVASYENKDALDMLKYIEQNNTYINRPAWPPSNKIYVLKAVTIHYNKIYDELIKKIKNEMNDCDLKNLGFSNYELLENNDKKDW